jgi:hypothetical protein
VGQFVFTGNEVEVSINGQRVDLAQNIRGTDNYGHEPASGIGDIHVKEYVPSVARHNITMSKLVMRKEKAISAGLILENGDDAMRGRIFDIEIFPKGGGPVLRKWMGCVNDGGDIGVTSHRILVQDATFLATDAAGQLSG